MKTFFLGVSHQLKTLLVLAIICISFSSCPEMFGKLNNIHDPSSSSYIAPSSRFTLTPGNLVNGSMTPATAIQVTSGAATTITAYANAGYVFDSWSATPSGNATFANFAGVTTTVTLTGDATVIAIFILSSQLIYKTDFSINPGWVANDSSRYYWDSATGSYYTNNYTNSGDWATTPISYNGGSFKLQFDIKATTRDTGDVCFGLFDSSRMSHNSPTAESLFVLLGGYTPVVYLEYNHNGINFSSPSNISWNTNTWYHTEVDYNSGLYPAAKFYCI